MKVIAHLVEVTHKTLKNPCGEIALPVLMEPKDITLLRLKGYDVFDYTESLNMGDELVDVASCYKYKSL